MLNQTSFASATGKSGLSGDSPPIRAAWRRLADITRLVALGLSMTCLCGTTGVAQTREGDEDQVRAAYLYNFAKFVEWPGGTQGKDDPVHICTIGNDRLGEVLQQTVAGKRANGRLVEARRLASVKDSSACEILFIGGTDPKRTLEILGALRRAPVLTVTEGEHFAALGAMVNLVRKDGSIELEINPEMAEAAGLKISSRLLVVAQVVKTSARSGAQP
jgi:hypothetical protein